MLWYFTIAQICWFGFRFFSKDSPQREIADTYVSPTYPIIAQFNYFNQFFFGIRKHELFMDEHFENYRTIITLIYKHQDTKEWLPLTNPKGQTVGYNQGFVWANWAFRVNGPSVNRAALEEGFKRYTAFWATRNGIPLDGSKFVIKLKKIDYPKNWQQDFLKDQQERDWEDIGEVSWEDGEFAVFWEGFEFK